MRKLDTDRGGTEQGAGGFDSIKTEETMNKTATLAACLLFAGPAFAQSVGEKTGVNAVLGVTPATADFVKEAASSDMFEIQSSQLAAQRSDGPTKAFATQMIADHEKTTAEIKSMVTAGTVKADLPSTMLPSHQSMLDKLKGLNGADFTKQYHSDQVTAHKDAVSLYQRYSKGGDNAALKSMTTKTTPILEHHLTMAQDLNK
jgi:putative membrane protein